MLKSFCPVVTNYNRDEEFPGGIANFCHTTKDFFWGIVKT